MWESLVCHTIVPSVIWNLVKTISSSINTHHHSLYIYNQSYHDIHSSISELLKCINKYCTPNMAYVFRASLVPEGTVSLIPFSFSLTNTWQPSLDLCEQHNIGEENTREIGWELFGVQIMFCVVWLTCTPTGAMMSTLSSGQRADNVQPDYCNRRECCRDLHMYSALTCWLGVVS